MSAALNVPAESGRDAGEALPLVTGGEGVGDEGSFASSGDDAESTRLKLLRPAVPPCPGSRVRVDTWLCSVISLMLRPSDFKVMLGRRPGFGLLSLLSAACAWACAQRERALSSSPADALTARAISNLHRRLQLVHLRLVRLFI